MSWRTTRHVPTPGGWTTIPARGRACQVVRGKQLGQRIHTLDGAASSDGLDLSEIVGFPTTEGLDVHLWSPAGADATQLLEVVWFVSSEFRGIEFRDAAPRSARWELLFEETIVTLSPGVAEVPDTFFNVYEAEDLGDVGNLRYREFAGHVWAQVGATYSDDWEVLIWGDNGASSALQILETVPAIIDGSTGCARLEGVRVPPRRFGLSVRNNHGTKSARVTRTIGALPWV